MAKRKNALTLSTKMPSNAEIEKLFGSVESIHKGKIGKAALGAAAKSVERHARVLAPRGTESDRKKRSKKQQKAADWSSVQLNTTIDSVVRQKEASTFAAIGPAYPHGNKAYFNQPRKRIRKHVLWGKEPKNVSRIYIARRNWMIQAFENSLPEQQVVIEAELRKSIDGLMKNV